MKKTIINSLVAAAVVGALFVNLNVISKNNAAHLKLATIANVFAQEECGDSGDGSESGESGASGTSTSTDGKCWTETVEPCPASTVTNTTTSSTHSGGHISIAPGISIGAGGFTAGGVGVTGGSNNTTTNTNVQSTSHSKTTCPGGGNDPCQPRDCTGEKLGSLNECKKTQG
jgi:hypothetical protein